MRTFTIVLTNKFNLRVNVKANDKRDVMKFADTLYGSGNWKFLSDTIGKKVNSNG